MRKPHGSLKLNMVINAVKGIMGVLFPLITFPYVSNILGVENIGKYNFAHSIVNYYVLIAGLGIAPYAIREGARLRDRESEFQKFADEIFSLNVVSTGISFLLLIPLFLTSGLQKYRILIAIFALQMIFKTVGIEWMFSIYENYTYITIRSIAFQLISIFLMFIFVRRPTDVNIYAVITVFSGVGSNVLNYFYARKNYCKVNWTWKIPWRKHIKPIMIMFATSVAVTIYVSSDVTILGFLCGEYKVGIYSVSTKVYTIVKTILSAVIVVALPRLSATLGGNNTREFQEIASDIYKTILTFVLPSAVGIILLRRQIILFISNKSYAEAESSMALLAIAIIFCMCAYYWSQCILVPMQKEKTVFYATIVSAVINIFLNFLLIPVYGENAAAVSTIIAEAYVFIVCFIKGRKMAGDFKNGKLLLKIALGCVCITIISELVLKFVESNLLSLVLCIGISFIVYIIIEMLLANEVIVDVYVNIKKKRHI